MLFLTEDECRSWRSRWGSSHPIVELSEGLSIEKLPASQLYARRTLEWVWETSGQRTLVWVDEYGIWPTSEELLLYQMMRRHHGDHQTIEHSPGHCLLRHEAEEGIAILFLCMLHGWGVQVMGDTYPYRVSIDHDGRVTVWADTESSARELLSRMNLTTET